MLARVLLAAAVLLGIAAATFLFQIGLWPSGVLAVALVIVVGLALARTWTGPREYRTGEYVESDRSFY